MDLINYFKSFSFDKEKIGVHLRSIRIHGVKQGNRMMSLDSIDKFRSDPQMKITKKQVISIEKGRGYTMDSLLKYLKYLNKFI